MAFSIRNPEAEAIARELVAVTGESLTAAVTVALRDRLARVKIRQTEDKARIKDELLEIGRRVSLLPTLSSASDDEIFGWDECGLPT